MKFTKFPNASLMPSREIPPRLRGRSEAQGRVFRGFTSQGGFYSSDIVAASPYLDPLTSPMVWVGTGQIRSYEPIIRTSFGPSKSTSQDKKSGRSRSSVLPKTGVGNFRSRRPYWVNGKPKCKSGFRYDFKRKLCVKIK
jgi:hypothetical protein